MKISEFQQHIKSLFSHNDIKRGPEKTYIWLVEEVGELGSAVLKDNPENIREEIADVIAWSVSLANIYNIDLEEILKKKYPPSCFYCKKNPCCCEKKLVK